MQSLESLHWLAVKELKLRYHTMGILGLGMLGLGLRD